MTQGVSNARDRDRKENEEYKHPEYTSALQTAVRSKSPIRHDQGKSTNSLHLGNSDASVTSIDAAFQKLATTLQEGFNLPKKKRKSRHTGRKSKKRSKFKKRSVQKTESQGRKEEVRALKIKAQRDKDMQAQVRIQKTCMESTC